MGFKKMSFLTRLCEADCSMDIGKMLKLTLSPQFRPQWQIIRGIRICAKTGTGPANSEFLLTITIATLLFPAFQRTLIWGGTSRTRLNQCALWCLMLVTESVTWSQKDSVWYKRSKTRSINSYSGIWLWREIKAASSYKVPAPLALA